MSVHIDYKPYRALLRCWDCGQCISIRVDSELSRHQVIGRLIDEARGCGWVVSEQKDVVFALCSRCANKALARLLRSLYDDVEDRGSDRDPLPRDWASGADWLRWPEVEGIREDP